MGKEDLEGMEKEGSGVVGVRAVQGGQADEDPAVWVVKDSVAGVVVEAEDCMVLALRNGSSTFDPEHCRPSSCDLHLANRSN